MAMLKFFRARYAKGYLDWLGEKRDWPVGRQLWWGHQIPIWTKGFDTAEACKSMQTRIESLEESQSGQIVSGLESETMLHVCIRDDDTGLQTKIESLGIHSARGRTRYMVQFRSLAPFNARLAR